MSFTAVYCFLSAPLLGGAAPQAPLLRLGPHQVTLEEAQLRINEVSPARAAELRSPAAFVEQVLVSEALLDAHLSERETSPASKAERDRALAFALETAIERSTQVTSEEVDAYYRAHEDHFNRDEAIQVWRIVVDSENEASEILAEVTGSATGVEVWSRLARERSRDEATRMRRGSLGFVHADGHTDVHEVRVNPNVFAAAAKLEDGALLDRPFPDGDRFSVLWRRGSRPRSVQPLSELQDRLRAVLRRKKIAERVEQIVLEQRREHLTEYAPSTLELIDYPVPNEQRRLRSKRQRSTAGTPAPKPTPRGDR